MRFFDNFFEATVRTLQATALQELTAVASVLRATGMSKNVTVCLQRAARDNEMAPVQVPAPNSFRICNTVN
jgi:hypothetical protein